MQKARGSHRTETEPRIPHRWTMHLVLIAGMLSIFAPGLIGQSLGAFAAILGVSYFVQNWRHAGWVTRNR